MKPQVKQKQAFTILQHAAWHCRFGPNSDTTVREPDAADMAAHDFLASLMMDSAEANICRRCKGSGTEPPNSRATATPEHLHEVRRKAALASAEARRNRKTVRISRAEYEKFLESRKS